MYKLGLALLVTTGAGLSLTDGREQEGLTPPNLRAPNAEEQRAGARAAIIGLDGLAASRRVRFDSGSGGLKWMAIPYPTAHLTAQEPALAVAAFMRRYGQTVLGVDSSQGRLDSVRVSNSDHLIHYRFAQKHAGYSVLHGELVVHVSPSPRGYFVTGVNGLIFPNITTIPGATYSRRAAEWAATGSIPGAMARQAEEEPVIVAHDESYRLAYRVLVDDPGRGASVLRYVDATTGDVFAESPGDVSSHPLSGSSEPRAGRATTGSKETVSKAVGRGALAGYETANGLDWYGASQTFQVYYDNVKYLLTDNGHTGASEIRIQDYEGAALTSSCDNEPIAQSNSKNPWTGTADGKEEVSAVHNLGDVVTYFYTRGFGSGMYNNGGVLRACVDGSSAGWNAGYSPTDSAVKFRQEIPGGDGPSVAARDVAMHEFVHGVTHHRANLSSGTTGTASVNEGLADYFGARFRSNDRCHGGTVVDTFPCVRFLHDDSMSTGLTCTNSPSSGHCLSVRLSAGLLDATEANGGVYATEVDTIVFQTIDGYLYSTVDYYDAAYLFVYFAVQVGHQATNAPWTSLHNARFALGAALWGTTIFPYPVVSASMSNAFALTVSHDQYVYDVSFEIDLAGGSLNYDGSVAWPDSVIPLGEHYFSSNTLSFSEDSLGWHSCGDGHTHGFRVDLNVGVGTVPFYTGLLGCGGSLMAKPGTLTPLPSRFAVRQAIQTPEGVFAASLLRNQGREASLGAQIRQYGITALEVDIPVGTVSAPIRVTVLTPQGRAVRRFTTEQLGPGTQRIPWDGKNDQGERAPPGVYVALVQHGSSQRRTHFVLPALR